MSNVFSELWLLFKGDTSDLKRSMDDATSSTKNLKNSVNSIDEAIDKVKEKFTKLTKEVLKTALALVSIHAVIAGFKNASNYDIEIGNISRALGVNVTELDAWDNAVQRYGGTAQSFQSSLRGLAEHFHTTASIAMQALPQLADVFSHLNRYSQFVYGKSLGLDEPTILLLQQGRREVESIIKKQHELGLVTKEQTEIADKFNNSLINVKHAFRSLFNAVAIPFLPYLQKFFEGLTKGIQYLTVHKDLVIGALTAIGSGLAIIAVELAISAGASVILFGKIAALIVLVALLFDDINGYLKGNKSLLGEYIDEWKRLFKIIEDGWDSALDKMIKYFDKFDTLRPLGKDISAANKSAKLSRNPFEFYLNYELIRKSLDLSSSTPLNSQTSNSILNSSAFNRNFTINSMPIQIMTQATDAEGISQKIGLTLPDHLNQTNYIFADNTRA